MPICDCYGVLQYNQGEWASAGVAACQMWSPLLAAAHAAHFAMLTPLVLCVGCILACADGVSWGEPARRAAQCAVLGSLNRMAETLDR